MPSTTFQRFLAQLHAQGREKGEGFDHSHFDGLLPDERPQVAALLRDAALQGDSTAINGLIYFDRAAAPGVLREVLAQLPRDSGDRPRVLFALSQLGPDPGAQGAMVDELRRAVGTAPPIQRTLIINLLRQMPPDATLVGPLGHYVHDESDGANRREAAKLALYWSGVAPDLTAAYRQHESLMTALESGNFFTRRRAFAELDQLLQPTTTR